MIFKCGSKKKSGKRILALVAILISVVMASPAFALMVNNRNIETEVYVIANTEATDLWTAVSTSTISPLYHRVIGYEICPVDSLSKENFIALADDTTVAGVASTDVFGEAEAATGQSLSKWLEYPKRLANGLVVHQGSRTYALIYYEDMRKF
jgi:hypothetical protein